MPVQSVIDQQPDPFDAIIDFTAVIEMINAARPKLFRFEYPYQPIRECIGNSLAGGCILRSSSSVLEAGEDSIIKGINGGPAVDHAAAVPARAAPGFPSEPEP